MTIGYTKAKELMIGSDWKARVTMNRETLVIQRAEIYHPEAPVVYTLRRDSAKKLLRECRVYGSFDYDTAILCYDHDASNEEVI